MGASSSLPVGNGITPGSYIWKTGTLEHQRAAVQARREELAKVENQKAPGLRDEVLALAIHHAALNEGKAAPADGITSHVIDGVAAAAYVAYILSENAFVTQSDAGLGRDIAAWAQANLQTAFGDSGKAHSVPSSLAITAGEVKALVDKGTHLAVALVRSQGLLEMIPNLFQIAALRLPLVIHAPIAKFVGADDTLVHAGLADVVAVRDTGIAILASYSQQEVHDLAIAAHLAAIAASAPIAHIFDGVRLANELASVKALPHAALASLAADAIANKAAAAAAIAGAASDDASLVSAATSQQFASAGVSLQASSDLSTAIKAAFETVKATTGRAYQPFHYSGAAEATVVLVTCGPGAALVEEVGQLLAAQGQKVGVLKVRILRPWLPEDFAAVLPKTARHVVAVEFTTPAEAPLNYLFSDISMSLLSRDPATHKEQPSLVHLNAQTLPHGVCPGLVLAIFEQVHSLQAAAPAAAPASLTVSLPESLACASLSALPAATVAQLKQIEGRVLSDTRQAVIWNMTSSARPVGAAVQIGSRILGNQLSLQTQSFLSQDAKATRAVTQTHLRFGQKPILASYPVLSADTVAIFDPSLLFLSHYNILSALKDEGTVLLNTAWPEKRIEQELPGAFKRQLAAKRAKLVTFDAAAIASQFGLADRLETILIAAFLNVCGGITLKWALAALKSSLKEYISDNSEANHQIAIDAVAAALRTTAVSEDWLVAPASSSSSTRPVFVSPEVLATTAASAAAACGRAPRLNPAIAERPYQSLINQIFGDRVVLADASHSHSLFGEKYTKAGAKDKSLSTSVFVDKAEYLYGVYLARLHHRQRLVDVVQALVDDTTVELPANLRAVLAQWLAARDDASESRAIGDRILRIVEPLVQEQPLAAAHDALTELLRAREYFAKQSRWIVGGDAWASDIGYSGIHHIIASGDDVNVLIVETDPYTKPSLDRLALGATKKDIGLYAMNYGDVYVASVSLYASQEQAIRAFTEADAFPGPSIVLAYLPDVADAEAESSAAVEAGAWPLYRWNPANEAAKREVFSLDSKKIREDLEEFLKRDNTLSLLVSAEPRIHAGWTASVEEEVVKTHGKLAASGSAGAVKKINMSILVLYGSDSGNGGRLAEKFQKKARLRGVKDVRCAEAKEYTPAMLEEEENVVFVMSTAGQGEMCGNAMEFWNQLKKSKSSLKATRYAIFGLGDSHYWGKNTEDSAKYFCKPAHDLDARLVSLGATRLVGLGLGDDQNENGYMGAWVPWETELFARLGVNPVEGESEASGKVLIDDKLKSESNYLRGHILRSLEDEGTGGMLPEDQKLIKFHGIYQQDDRDVRQELTDKGLERAYSFMVRVGIPGGVCTAEQYLIMDRLSETHANHTIKATTRQAFQLHGVLKGNLKDAMKEINKGLMDTLAACGDVCRNVIASPNPFQSEVHPEVLDFARRLSTHLKPQTTAYHEIWLDKKQVGGDANQEIEPLYGKTYLPRKFKVAIAIPPMNDVDVFSHCLGYIAIVEKGKLVGYNVTVGGGMGVTHGNVKTFPRLADLLCFCTPEQAVLVGEKVMLVQRDHGDRVNRKHARLKYTVEDHGVEWYRTKVEEMCGFKLQKARPFQFESNSDRYGWNKDFTGKFSYTMFVQGGRIRDDDECKMKTALRELAEGHLGDFRLTANQNIILGGIAPEDRPRIEAVLSKYGIDHAKYSNMRLNSMACVALPTCALSMAEAERYLPTLMDKIDQILFRNGLEHEDIVIRMSGCPNGCSRPWMAEIVLVGKAPGVYNLYLGGGFAGNRLAKIYREGVNEQQILELLDPLLADYSKTRQAGERFGDFVIRKRVVAPTLAGSLFHEVEYEKNLVATTTNPTKSLQIYW